MESLRLFLGSEIAPIVILGRLLGGAVEEYIIDTDGRLVYTWRDTRWDLPDGVVPERRKVILARASDFRELYLESVAVLHRCVTRENFLDRLAWREGRRGRPGYRPWGFEGERDSWRVRSADPGEKTRRFRKEKIY